MVRDGSLAGKSSDAEVGRVVWDALSHDLRVDVDQIVVDVTDGVVFLGGTVTSLYDKRALTEVVIRLKGVLEVVNESRVAPTEGRSDEELATAVRDALARDARIDERDVEVTAREGVVRLSGKVDSFPQKYYAEGDAWATPGVVDILNSIVIEAAPARSDGDIARRTRLAGRRQRRVRPDGCNQNSIDS